MLISRINKYHTSFFCCLIVIISATFYVGAVPTRVFGHDIFFLLDNGWRIVNGQIPHVDFTSAWGAVTFLIVGMGLLLSDYTVDGIGYGSAVFGLVVGLWSYYLCKNRLIPILQILLSLYIVSLVVAPFPLGVDFKLSSHAMVYNRYGYALLALILIDVFPVKGGGQKEAEFIRGLSTGVAVAITFFLKASYFGGAVILLAASLLLKGFSRTHFLGLLLGFLTATLALLFFIQFDVVSLLNDLEMAAGARVHSVYVDTLLLKLTYNSPIFVLVILMSVQVYTLEKSKLVCSDYCVLFAGIMVIFVDALILFSNQQFFNLPLSAVFSLLLVNRLVLLQNQEGGGIKSALANSDQRSLVFSGGLFFLCFFAMDIAGLGYGVLQKTQLSKTHSSAKFIEPRLTPLLLFDNDTEPRSNGRLYTEYINDGIQLLQNNSQSYETILTIDMFNPFSYSMGRKPAKGGIAAAAFNYTLSDKHHPSADKYFGSAGLVMVPKEPAAPHIFYDGFYKIYESALMQRFHQIAESDFWFLYRRK